MLQQDTWDALHIDSCHVVIVPTKHIAYFLSFFLCLFFLFFLFICRCSLALSRTLQVSKHGFPRRHRLLRALSFILFMLSCHLHFMFVLWLLYAEFHWTLYLYYVFDNGSVHHLVVGSEPTHCDGYLSLCILHIYAYLVSYHWWVKLYGLC